MTFRVKYLGGIHPYLFHYDINYGLNHKVLALTKNAIRGFYPGFGWLTIQRGVLCGLEANHMQSVQEMLS